MEEDKKTITKMNTNSSCSYIKTNPIDPIRVTLKITGLALHTIYLLIAVYNKKLRNKQLIFLNNFNMIVIFILIYSLYREYNVCVSDVGCTIEALGLFLAISYESYSITILLAYRIICLLTDKVRKFIQWKFIIPILISFYLLVFVMNLIIYENTEKEISFVKFGNRCAILSRDGLFIYLMLIFNNIIPSFISICGALWIIIKIKLKNVKVIPLENEMDDLRSSQKTSLLTQSAFDLSCQIILFVISFQIFSNLNLLLIYNASQPARFLSPQITNFFRTFRWSAFIVDSLALFLFNPFIKQYLKSFWVKIKASIV